MPYRKRMPYKRRRRTYRKRRYRSKKKLVRKLKRSNNQLNIKQRVLTSQAITAPLLVPSVKCSSMQFALGRLARFRDFRQMFDKYKINGVAVRFTLEDSLRAPTGGNLKLVYRIDPDGSSVTDTTSVETMMACGNCKIVNLNANRLSHSVFLKPRYLTPIYTGAAAPFGYNAGNRGWLDTNSPDILHYGLEWGWTNFSQDLPNGAVQVNCQITVVYYISLKGIIATSPPDFTDVDDHVAVQLQVDPVSGNPNQAQIDALQAQINDLMLAHDSDNDHDSVGNVSHPNAAYY